MADYLLPLRGERQVKNLSRLVSENPKTGISTH
jgi:hypothetical protein